MRPLLSALVLLVPSVLCASAVPAQQPPYLSDPKFQKEVAAAKAPHQRWIDQVDHWKKANKIANGTCAACLQQAAFLQLRMGEFKDAMGTAAALKAAGTTPTAAAAADLIHGLALLGMRNGKPHPDQLAEADASFKSALASDPSLHAAQYFDGIALARLNRDDEARPLFASYAAALPESDHYHLRAQHFSVNPALARARMAPPFAVTTADGKQFTLDDMGGRVVLVDFWATWCGPCNEELPHIQKIAQEFAGQPFVLISVSWDSDPAKWQAFIDAHKMTWNQYRDADHQLSNAYAVNAIPHYFTIDADGVLQDEQLGSGADIEGKLRKLVARARAAAPLPTSTPGGN